MKRLQVGQTFTPQHLTLSWTVVQVESNGVVAFNKETNQYQFFWGYQLS